MPRRTRPGIDERRSAYADLLARRENASSVVGAGTCSPTRSPGNLYVVAAVKGNRILTTSLVQEPLDATKDGLTERESSNMDNPSTAPSMPCLIYAYPRDWRPASLTLAVVFQDEPYPAEIWGHVHRQHSQIAVWRGAVPAHVQRQYRDLQVREAADGSSVWDLLAVAR
ncbi:MAG TPA: hypothetical protein VJ846_10165 [Sphingomicrobium sp.]|nr:hypothetical protein [Sphingomicrobium sp.]